MSNDAFMSVPNFLVPVVKKIITKSLKKLKFYSLNLVQDSDSSDDDQDMC